jgi:hypothetical protein
MKNLVRTGIIICLLVSCQSGHKQIHQIGKWQIFETSVFSRNEYQNPFEDVELEVTYTCPDGREIQFSGFFAGKDTWRIRFMPDTTGIWEYRASFSDGSGSAKGRFQCVDKGFNGMPGIFNPNPIWFGDSYGEPFLVRSLHVGDRFFADNWNPKERETFLEWFQSEGYNTLSIASFLLNRDSEGRGQGWDTPDLWDSILQRPNPSEYEKLEKILDQISERGIVIYPFAGFFGRNSDILENPENWELFIDYTISRLGPYGNLIFNVAGPEPLLRNNPYLKMEEVIQLGKTISRLDVFNHLLTVHNATGDDVFRAQNWVSLSTLQGPKTLDRNQLSTGILRTHHPNKPLFAQETLWPGNKHHPEYSLDDIRKNGLVILMSGAMINFADHHGNSSSGFSGSLKLEDRHQEWHEAMHKTWDFFDQFDWWMMTPRQDLVNIGYCLANPGKEYIIYLPEGGEVNVKVPTESYQVNWWNPESPEVPVETGESRNGKNLQTPKGGDDWMLQLIKK